MIENPNYTLALIVEVPVAYACFGMMIHQSPVADSPYIEVNNEDPEIGNILFNEMKWSPKKAFNSDNILVFAQRVSQPMKPSDVLTGRYKQMFTREQRKEMIELGNQWRQTSFLKIPIVVRQPGDMDISTVELYHFIHNIYKPLIKGYCVHDDFIPDDFETTLNLINHEPDIIPEDQRTMHFTMPFRDIFNTIHLMEVLESAIGPLNMKSQVAESAYVLPFDIVHEQHLHLFAFTLAEICSRYKGVDWTLIPTRTTTD